MSLRLFSLAVESPETPPEVVDWLITALREHLATGQSLDVILGLKKRGSKSRQLRTVYLLKRRNRFLYEAWTLSGKPTTTKGWKDFATKVRRACDIKKTSTMLPLSMALYNAYHAGALTSWKEIRLAVISVTIDLCQPSTATQQPEAVKELEPEIRKTGT